VAKVSVLIPTYRRKTGLAVVLASLLGQHFTDFDVVVSDQTPAEECYLEAPEISTAVEALRWRGHDVRLLRHLPARGLAEQRQFLLEQARAPYVQFLDDDLLLEPRVLERMVSVMRDDRCGFVGCAAVGLGFVGDVRPHEQHIELWDGPVEPERLDPDELPLIRHRVNNAANPLHLERRFTTSEQPVVRYRVAWVGANVLYDRQKLLSVGGFDFWPRLPAQHAGEDVVVQLLLLDRYGGCGVLPSGTYHLGLPTTVERREVNAIDLLPELLARVRRDISAVAAG
jgi:glycosyltransferase involved in cell wall biosynthesis